MKRWATAFREARQETVGGGQLVVGCNRQSNCMRLLLPGPSRCLVHSDDIVHMAWWPYMRFAYVVFSETLLFPAHHLLQNGQGWFWIPVGRNTAQIPVVRRVAAESRSW